MSAVARFLARMTRHRAIRLVAAGYIELFRAVPVLLLLFAFLIALPRLGLTLPVFWQLVGPIVLSNMAVESNALTAIMEPTEPMIDYLIRRRGLTRDQVLPLLVYPDANSDVDPDKECYPSGQGVGAIHEVVPAGDLVRRIVDEAEHALARAATTVVR